MSLCCGPRDEHCIYSIGCQKSKAEGENHLPHPAGPTAFDVAQDIVCFLCCELTLLGCVGLLIHQHTQLFLFRAALDSFFVQPVLVVGIALTKMQDLAFVIVKLMKFALARLSSRVSLDGIPSSMPTTQHSLVSTANLVSMH